MKLLAATSTGGADLSIFGHDPWWLIIIKTVVIFVFQGTSPGHRR